jgi:Uma2 family endonuclease
MSPHRQAELEAELAAAAMDYDRALAAHLSATGQEAMAETEDHQDASYGSRDALRAFFRRAGGSLYIAANLAVYYPGEPHFEPDLLAVRDVPQRRRDSYIVAKEGKGLDLVVEVLNRGNREKDLSENVERYARLQIPEYFVADLRRRRIHQFRLEAGAHRYTPVLGAYGRYRSAVLGLDLILEGEQLRFYSGTAAVPLLGEEVERLTTQVERERELAEAAQREAEAAQREAEALRERLKEALRTILRLRGIELPAEQAALVACCQDSALLLRWLDRAATASLDGLFLDS